LKKRHDPVSKLGKLRKGRRKPKLSQKGGGRKGGGSDKGGGGKNKVEGIKRAVLTQNWGPLRSEGRKLVTDEEKRPGFGSGWIQHKGRSKPL